MSETSEAEAKQAAELAVVFHRAMQKLESDEERRHFVKGAIDAAYLDKHHF